MAKTAQVSVPTDDDMDFGDESSETMFELNPEDVPDVELLPDGEYQVRVQKAEVKESKAGDKYFNIVLVPVDHPAAEPIYYSLFPPKGSDDERKKLNKQRRIKAFLEAAGVPLGPYRISQTEEAVLTVRLTQKLNQETIRNEVAAIL